jgi:hypothetical protein
VGVNKSKASLNEVGLVGSLAKTVIILAVRIERKKIVRSFYYFVAYKYLFVVMKLQIITGYFGGSFRNVTSDCTDICCTT